MAAVVCKFGGTSMADAAQFRRVAAIVRGDDRRRFVVVSAPGKRNKADAKITDLLYLCHEQAVAGRDIAEPFGSIRQRFLEIARDLQVSGGVSDWIDEVERKIRAGASADYAASRGEYLSARLAAEYLGASFVDAEGAILLTPDGRVDEATYEGLARRLGGGGRFVLPGFYGSSADGQVRTFSRGGSDISGAIVARAVGAEVYENWTDVSGFLMADPGLVQSPRPMKVVTYREIRELAYMGAKVFHEEAIFPVFRQGIPINIRNTNAPDESGTMIVAERDPESGVVAGIAGKTGFSRIVVERFMMDREPDFRARLMALLKSRNLRFGPAPAGVDSLSVVVDEEPLRGQEEDLLAAIRDGLKPDRAEIRGGLALVAVVGEGLAHHPGIAGRLFQALAEEGVRVRLIDYGSSEITILIGVDTGDFNRTINALYRAFA